MTTAGGPGITTTTLPYAVYKTGQLQWELGEAAAYAIVMVIVALVILTLLFRYFQRRKP